ncbi:MAG: hypothetical protein LBJ46_09465 [Planctomycetota bacterium]|jgi:hypothetical protein|nr:hypothetical protein [Planctomycetota bacterium]
MDPLDTVNGTHKIVTLRVPGRPPARVLCLCKKDAESGGDAYYVLAENEGKALKWRSMIRDNAVRRLREEFLLNIIEEQDVDNFDVEAIFFCSAEASKT